MNTVRLIKGEIFFDDFDLINLDSRWTILPQDSSRYSLTERSGFIKLLHGTVDLMMLTDEPGASYVMDIRNEYVPLEDSDQAGIIIFRTQDDSLELLEYYDPTKDSSIVYEYLRVIKQGSIYTFYGMNTLGGTWELIGSVEYTSAGKVGLIVKGLQDALSQDLQIDFVRIYQSQEIQFLNVPFGYMVTMCYSNGQIASAAKVADQYSGVNLLFTDIPNLDAYFQIFDTNNQLVHTSATFPVCGGDVYFYGAVLTVDVNGNDMSQDTDYFLGYFQNSVINFTIEISNTYNLDFLGVTLQAVQYDTDPSYTMVTFDIDPAGTFTASQLSLGTIVANGSATVYGRITRNVTLDNPPDITPYKFNLQLENS
jgi:hypothetical protein